MDKDPVYFATPADFRRWLEVHAAKAPELIVGFMKVGSDLPSITWPESVDEALCFGWIDSTQKRYSVFERAQRFSPRKKRSNWTELNKERARRLIASGKMTAAGQAVLPDLAPEAFAVPADILAALEKVPLKKAA